MESVPCATAAGVSWPNRLFSSCCLSSALGQYRQTVSNPPVLSFRKTVLTAHEAGDDSAPEPSGAVECATKQTWVRQPAFDQSLSGRGSIARGGNSALGTLLSAAMPASHRTNSTFSTDSRRRAGHRPSLTRRAGHGTPNSGRK